MKKLISLFLFPISIFASALTGVPLGPSSILTQVNTNGYNVVVQGQAYSVISVFDWGAIGNGTNDDSIPIQNAINYWAYTNGAPRYIYFGFIGPNSLTTTQLIFQCSNALQIPTLTNQYWTIASEATRSGGFIGDGPFTTILRFPNSVNTNGITWEVHNTPQEAAYYRFLSYFKIQNLGIWGPGWTNVNNEFGGNFLDNINITSDGIFIGRDPNISSAGANTTSWNLLIDNCSIYGWRNGVIITNTVRSVVQNCTFKYNWNTAIAFSGCDTWCADRNIILGTQNTSTNSTAAIVQWADNSGNPGRGGEVRDCEIGGYNTAILGYGGSITVENGNYERNGAITTQSNGCYMTIINPHILANILGIHAGSATQGGLFIFGDNGASGGSVIFQPYITGLITNGTVVNSQATNYFCCYGTGAFVPPTFYGIPQYGGNYFYGKYNTVNTFVTASVGNSGVNVWTGTHQFQNGNVPNSMNVGADKNAITLTSGNEKSFEIDAPSDGGTTYTYSLLSYDASGGARVAYLGGSLFGNLEIDYLRLGGGSGGQYILWHGNVFNIGGGALGALATQQANKAALLTSNIVVSPWLWTNPFNYNVQAFISGAGGGSNSIAVNGIFVGYMTNGFTAILQPNEYLWNTNGAAHPNFSFKPF